MTEETWRAVLLVLAAIVAGAAIPVLFQLRATLRAMELTFRESGPRLGETLGAVKDAAGRIDAAVTQFRDTVRVASAVGAAVGPAVGAAVRAFREIPAVRAAGPADGAHPGPESAAAHPGKPDAS